MLIILQVQVTGTVYLFKKMHLHGHFSFSGSNLKYTREE